MRMRTTVGFVVIIALVLVCSITTLLTQARNSGEFESQQMLKTVADNARDDLQRPDWKGRLEKLAASDVVTQKNITIVVFGRSQNRNGDRNPNDRGRGADRSENRPPERPPVIWKSQKNIPPMRPRADPGAKLTPEIQRQQKQWDATWRAYGEGVPDAEPGLRRFVLVVRPFTGFLNDMDHRRMDMLLMGGLIVLVVGIGAWLLVGRTLSPIRRLVHQAANASAENLSVQLAAPSNDAEVVDLVSTLNGLLGRLAETAESKGRFYAAASHELRTPLQALSGHLELALSRTRSAEEYRAALEEANKQSRRLKSLVQSLLLLHQLENAPDQEKDPIDVAAVTRAALSHLEPSIGARKLKLDLALPEEASAMAISNHAEILIRNLLENAVKYASEGGQVRVKIANGDGGPTLEVFDQCEPITNWNEDKVYEAFNRPDPARNARTGGNGLGLAICKAIAHANGWALSVDQVEGGFQAFVEFSRPAPMAKASEKRRAAKSVSVVTKPVL